MAIPIRDVHTVDTVQLRTSSPAAKQFKQAMDLVSRVGPVSPAFAQSRRSGAAGMMADTNQAQADLERQQWKMLRTGDAHLAPQIAKRMQELDYHSTVAAKSLAKVVGAIKELSTAT